MAPAPARQRAAGALALAAAPPLPLMMLLLLAAAAAPAAATECRQSSGAAHAWCGLPAELSNFQGNRKCDSSALVGRSRTLNEMAALVRAHPRARAAGVGHSWAPELGCPAAAAGRSGGGGVASNASAIGLLTTEFQDLLEAVASNDYSKVMTVDEAAMTVTTPAGATQRALLEFLAGYRTPLSPVGYTLGSFCWFIDQTVGGAVATASHGSSLLHGSLSSQVVALKWMDARGDVRSVSAASDPHLFRALTVSAGRLGIVTELTLRIVRNKSVRRRKQDLPIDDMLAKLRGLQDAYVAARGGGASAASANSSASIAPLPLAAPNAAAVWRVLRPWEATQFFWHIPLRSTWLITYERSDNDTAAPPRVEALQGPAGAEPLLPARPPPRGGLAAAGLPPGAHRQVKQPSVGAAPGIEVNPLYWAGVYAAWLNVNVQDETLPARQAYLSLSEMENVLYSPYNSYAQYELAVPLARAADCMAALSAELYGSRQLWRGFRSPALARLVAGEEAYLSPSAGGPALYLNLEDHVGEGAGAPANAAFQAAVALLRAHPACRARLHWGKAGWEEHARCFDGAKEYGVNWCQFGCAVRSVDPTNKFAGASPGLWQWFAAARRGGGGNGSGAAVDFDKCCGPRGFDAARCVCASRPACV